MAKPPWKPLRLAPVDVEVTARPGGARVLRSRLELGPHPPSLGVHLRHWARTAPARTFLAERNTAGDWHRVSFATALESVERIAGALLARELPRDRPLVILSDNGIDHALLALGALHVGIPVAPVSTAYSLLSRDHAQLAYILELTRPSLVFAADGARYAAALTRVPRDGVELVVSGNPPPGRPATLFADLLATPPGREVESRFAEVGPDTVAKVLFTSGSTGRPKGVINTQRMLCSNQQAIAQGWPFLEDRPPVVVDWLPWSHTFGGNHNFNMVLRNGGTLYIDAGKPAPGLFDTTLRTSARYARPSTSTCRAASTCSCPGWRRTARSARPSSPIWR